MRDLAFRIGYGYDVHAFAFGRDLIIGGIKIDYDRGLEGHSDADVLLHAISDAILGALALGDIGVHFPPSDNKYKNIDSKILLREVVLLMEAKGYEIANIDATIIAERPKMNPHIPLMRQVIATIPQARSSVLPAGRRVSLPRLSFSCRKNNSSPLDE